MKGQRLIAFGLGLGLLCTLVWLTALWQRRRADVPLRALMAERVTFPTDWDSGEIDVLSADWREAVEFLSSEPEDSFHATSNLGRIWTAQGNQSPRVWQHLYQYDNSIAAAWQYSLSRPETAYSDDWPNFANPKNKGNRYPTDWYFHSPFADQEHLVCAMGSPASCQTWYYWARYGQYILSIELWAPSQGMDTATFAQIVAEVDTYIGGQLGGASGPSD